jgi:hypothetical protein
MPRDILIAVVGTLGGGIVGVVAGVLFEDVLRQRLERVKKWRLRQHGEREIARAANMPVTFGDTFSFGSLKTTIFLVDGNGETPFRRSNIKILLSQDPVEFPEELRTFKHEVELRERRKKRAGQQHLWNGANYAVRSCAVTRTGLTEESEMRLGLQPSDYYNFLAAKESLDTVIPKYGKTVREYYLDPFYWNRPVPFLSSSFGVNVTLITADDQLVVCKRSELVGSRPLEYTVSANEGLSRGIDDAGGNPPDLYECGYRALREELGIEKDEVDRLDILAFIIDLQWHQWGCLGTASLGELTYPELRNRYNRAPKDKFENIELDHVVFAPKPVAQYVLDRSRRDQWYGGAPVSFYLSLVASYGRHAVERAIKEADRQRD